MSNKTNVNEQTASDELLAALRDSADAVRDQTRAIDELVLSNNRLLDVFIEQQQNSIDQHDEPKVFLNGKPRD